MYGSLKSIDFIVFLISEGQLASLNVKVLIGCMDWTALVEHEQFPSLAEHHPAFYYCCVHIQDQFGIISQYLF